MAKVKPPMSAGEFAGLAVKQLLSKSFEMENAESDHAKETGAAVYQCVELVEKIARDHNITIVEAEGMKTARELIDECNSLAMSFYKMHGYQVPDDYRFYYEAHHPQEKLMWRTTEVAYEWIDGTAIDDCFSELEDEGRK